MIKVNKGIYNPTFPFILLFLLLSTSTWSQSINGTTGLLRMPTADMQKDKTFMIGGNVLNTNTLSSRWSKQANNYTFNYFINITIFPWLEISYICTLLQADYGSNYFPPHVWGKYCNQDRAFSGRLRIWKEGWWKEWTPQIVIGADDAGSHESAGGGEIISGNTPDSNNYFTRYYLSITKHFHFHGIGNLGTHVAFICGKAKGIPHYKRPAFGLNFNFKTGGETFGSKLLNNLNIMTEYDARTFNVGGGYSIWKDYINIIAELNDGKHFSGGVFFNVHLK